MTATWTTHTLHARVPGAYGLTDYCLTYEADDDGNARLIERPTVWPGTGMQVRWGAVSQLDASGAVVHGIRPSDIGDPFGAMLPEDLHWLPARRERVEITPKTEWAREEIEAAIAEHVRD